MAGVSINGWGSDPHSNDLVAQGSLRLTLNSFERAKTTISKAHHRQERTERVEVASKMIWSLAWEVEESWLRMGARECLRQASPSGRSIPFPSRQFNCL